MLNNNKNLLQNFFYSIRVRIFLIIGVMAFSIYCVVSVLSYRSDARSLTVSRQFYLNELKLFIHTEYNIASGQKISEKELQELAEKSNLLLDKGPLYNYVITSYSEDGKKSVEEFNKVFELAVLVTKNKGNLEELRRLNEEALKYPSNELYYRTILTISNNILQVKFDKHIVFFTLLITFIISFLFLQVIAGRIGLITYMAKKLINDDESLQLNGRLNFKAQDETQYIVTNINVFMDKLENYTVQLINSAKGLIYQITQMFEVSKSWTLETQVMRHSTERISRQMSEQIYSLNQAAAALEEMERTLDAIFNTILRQSTAMTQSAATLEEMGRQVEGVAKISADTAGLATRLTEIANKGNEAVEASIVSIKDVAEYSSQILKLLQLISGIAKQTNLLAMNASIEAAHAGEAGRGFAIVAEEIRRLSETTNKNAKEIKTVVDTMVDKIDNSVEQARIAGEDLIQINTYAENVSERIDQLNNMMQQQNTATHEMITTIEGLVTLAQEIKISMEEQQFGLHEYSKTIDTLQDNFGEVKSTLNGHMSSVNNLLVILTDMGIRISIQKTIMDNVQKFLNIYKVNPDLQVSESYIKNTQDAMFLEYKKNTQQKMMDENKK